MKHSLILTNFKVIASIGGGVNSSIQLSILNRKLQLFCDENNNSLVITILFQRVVHLTTPGSEGAASCGTAKIRAVHSEASLSGVRTRESREKLKENCSVAECYSTDLMLAAAPP